MERDRARAWLTDAIDVAGPGEVLTGWVLVSESVAPDGRRRLRTLSGPAALPEWQVAGYLHAALAPGGAGTPPPGAPPGDAPPEVGGVGT